MNDEFNLSDEGDFTSSEARLAELLFRYADNTCSEADEQALAQALLTLPDLRRRFVELALQRVSLERILREETASQPFATTGTPSSTHTERPRVSVLGFLGRTGSLLARPVFWSILLVAAGFYGAFALIAWNLRDGTLLPGTDGNDLAVATIRATSKVEWDSDNSAVNHQRSAINAGEPLQISSGLVELQLKQGTTLVIEGPADWTIDGDNRAILRHGKLVAKVPSRAVGFTLKTPTATIVDLGTEFAVAVNQEGEGKVQVIKGKVELIPQRLPTDSAHATTLVAGQAVRIGADDDLAPLKFDRRAFVRTIPKPSDAEMFSPDRIPGLRLWLCGDRGLQLDDAGRLQAWHDQSGHACHAMQSEAQARPTAGPTAPDSALRVIRFDGVDDCLECTSSLQINGRGSSTIAMLLRVLRSSTSDRGLFCLRSHDNGDWNSIDALALIQGSARPNQMTNIQAMQTLKLGANVRGAKALICSATVPLEQWAVVVLTRVSGVASMRVNGVTTQFDEYDFSDIPGKSPRPDDGYCLGRRFTPKWPLAFGYFDLVELLAFDRALEGKPARSLTDYLNGRLTLIQAHQNSN